MARINSQKKLFCRIDDSCFRVKGGLIEETTNRIFKVGDTFIIFDLKELCRRFGLEWNFASSRNGKQTSCNRASRKISFVGASIRKLSSITCERSWCIRFEDIERNTCSNTDSVVITVICGVHSNPCDPSYVDQFVLTRTCSSNYKNNSDQCLKEFMIQMVIKHFVSIRAIRELLFKLMSERKYIDCQMINNIRNRDRKKKVELENTDIKIDPKIFTLHLLRRIDTNLIIIPKVNILLS